MACPGNGRYEKRTSRHERETLYDEPRSKRHRRNDRSYDRQDDSIRQGDRRGPNGRARQESGRQRPRRESSRDEVFVVYEERQNSRGSGNQRQSGQGRGSAAQRSTASGNTATSGGSQATGDISPCAASSDWRPAYAECEGQLTGWLEMSNEVKLEHLGEPACREQASRARDILG